VQTYPSLGEFYNANKDRMLSGEADYGVNWTVKGHDWPRWRVSYVQATGEIYATAPRVHSRVQGGLVRVLGVVPPDPDTRYQDGNWATGPAYYRTLDKILEGWADPDVSGHDLAWVASKLAGYQAAGQSASAGALAVMDWSRRIHGPGPRHDWAAAAAAALDAGGPDAVLPPFPRPHMPGVNENRAETVRRIWAGAR